MFLSRKSLSQVIKLLTQADTRKPCVYEYTRYFSQSREGCCKWDTLWTQKSLCVLKETGV